MTDHAQSPAPDSRDAVIAQLVWALEKTQNRLIWASGLIKNDAARDKTNAWFGEFDAVLAAAKVVMK